MGLLCADADTRGNVAYLVGLELALWTAPTDAELDGCSVEYVPVIPVSSELYLRPTMEEHRDWDCLGTDADFPIALWLLLLLDSGLWWDWKREDKGIIQICSGITCVRVHNGELYAQGVQKLIYLHLLTDCFMNISLQSLEQIFMKQSVNKCR